MNSNTSDVEKLIDRVLTEGVNAGNKKKDDLIAEGNAEKQRLINDGKKERERIIKQAEEEARQLKDNANTQIHMAARDFMIGLKKQVEDLLLNVTVKDAVQGSTKGQNLSALVTKAVIAYASNDGREDSLDILLGKDAEALQSEIATAVSRSVKDISKKNISVKCGDFAAGFQIVKGGIVLDFSEEALKEAIVEYVKPQFRNAFFSPEKA